MKITSLILPTLLAAAVMGFLIYDETPTTNVDAIPASALNDHISSGAAVMENSYALYPISQYITNSYVQNHENVSIRVNNNGNTEGFRKFCRNEITLLGSSRPITQEEILQCNSREIRYIEIPIAMDATVIVTNRTNNITTMTEDQLRTLWNDGEPTVINWNDIDHSWPDRRIDIFGPSLTSNESVQLRIALWEDEAHAMRDDYTQLRLYSDIVSNLSTNSNALSFMSLANYREFQTNMKIINVNNVEPNTPNIQSGMYPLTHFLFLYINPDSIVNPNLLEYVQYYIEQAQTVVERFGYTPLTTEAYELYNERMNRNVTGTAFLGRLQSGTTISEVMAAPLCCGAPTYPVLRAN